MQERLIRHIRESLGLTQQDFAQQLGISQATVSRWEAGRVSPDADMRRRIHEMAKKDGGLADAPLYALVRQSPSFMALMDMDLRILVLSDTAAALHRMAPQEAIGVNYRSYFTEDMEQAYDQALAGQFFTGSVLSVELFCQTLTLQGETVFLRGSWHMMARPSTGQPLLLWQGVVASEADYRAYVASGAPKIRLLGPGDWLNDEGAGAEQKVA